MPESIIPTEPPTNRLKEEVSTQPRVRIEAIPGTERDFGGCTLGRVGGRWVDDASVPVDDAGIDYRVSQASYGFTGVSVVAHPGYRVEALRVDTETGQPSWEPPPGGLPTLIVDGDWGNLSLIAPDSSAWKQENMGNAGVRAGVVRVTNEQSDNVKFYLVGAQFNGRPDYWNVTNCKISEITYQES